jgi:hypothetical protein
MAKVRTFSRRYPATHPRKGEETHFVEKFLMSVGLEGLDDETFKAVDLMVTGGDYGLLPEMIELYDPKHHTIRGGKHFKAGDYFSPRVWSEGAYHSPMIKLAPDTRICRVWDIELDLTTDFVKINGEIQLNSGEVIKKLAKNDGLTEEDFRGWFRKPFKGQIICWNPEIKY